MTNSPKKYGITWYAGEGEHGYKEAGYAEYDSLVALLTGFLKEGLRHCDEDLLFDALVNGPGETVYWITDDFGFAFYRP